MIPFGFVVLAVIVAVILGAGIGAALVLYGPEQ